jgi:hypothetical protein
MSAKGDSKKEAAQLFDAKLKAAMDEARAAGVEAAREFAKRAPRDSYGNIAGSSGVAYVKVTRPTRKFREALTRLDARAEGYHHWTVLAFGDEIGLQIAQLMDAQQAACAVALNVMSNRFPDEHFLVDFNLT